MESLGAKKTYWHSIDLKELVENLATSEKGLLEEEAAKRLQENGPNSLPQKPPPSIGSIFLRQFLSPMIYILGLAALVSIFLGDVKDASFIAGVLILNAVIGTFQEWRAEKSSFALKKLLKIIASVQRDGIVKEINAEAVVPGDVVWLESGKRIPADIRLLTSHSLEIDESLLTGESLPILKDTDSACGEKTPVADQLNMAFAGSIVTRGRGKGIVVGTGTSTIIGQLAVEMLSETGGKPPLLIRMERFTQVIAVAVLALAAVVGVLGVTIGGYSLGKMFLFAVALAVSVIPEGLPVAMTIALAIGTTRMAKRGLIVRRLTAVEGLGSCTLIATDKTGTLTCNELTVQVLQDAAGLSYQVTGQGYPPLGQVMFDNKVIDDTQRRSIWNLVRAAILCNEASLHHKNSGWYWRGDSVDIALLSLGEKLNLNREALLDQFPQVNEIPFEPEHRFSATYHRTDSKNGLIVVKGAPERVLSMCTSSIVGHYNQDTLEQQAISLAEQGYRVIALAEGQYDEATNKDLTPPNPDSLIFLGYVGMIDPLRAGVKEAVGHCHEAGVSVTMVTGDHRVTAFAIGRELGLANHLDQVMTGVELARQSDEQLQEILDEIRIFARVTPQQKLQIVAAAQKKQHFVSVTGDGVNDAPALREANIGIAMGDSGTDVAREAAELVIADDNFSTIVSGIEEGRVAYDNIRKVIYLLVSTGVGELVLMMLTFATGMPYLPLLPVQLLWLNLVTNGIQDVALAFEPNEGDALNRRPRPTNEGIFNQLMIERTVIAALVIGIVGFFTFKYYLPENPSPSDVTNARNALLLLMVLFENLHIGNCRSETKSLFSLSPFRSPIIVIGTLTAFSIHMIAMHTPFGKELLQTQPVTLKDWGILFGLAFIIIPVMEIHKWSWNKRRQLADK